MFISRYSYNFLFTHSSIDAWRNEQIEAKVPFWNYFLLKFQFFILYFIAGLKKFSPEWLEGYSMSHLSHHWIFFPFRAILGAELANLVIIHWFATFFDTTIVFFLIYRKTRVIATLFSLAFHLMNSRLFNIGMFPFVCIAELVLFYEFDFPRTFLTKLKCFASEKLIMKRRLPLNEERIAGKCTFKEKFTTFLVLIYCCLQLFLPYSHFITKGYNNWRHLYGFSWDMMLSEWSTMFVSVRIHDNGNNREHLLEPLAFTDSYRWTQYPDMTYQYCQCINQNLIHDFRENSQTILTSDNFSIFFDIWCSLNGRFQQRIYNPTIDILNSEWHPFKEPSFILPLLNEYSYLRKEIEEITSHVYSWNNYTDLLFIADFPGLTMDNYILPEMENVTLTVLKGIVKFEYENGVNVSSLSHGQRTSVKSGEFHKVTTMGEKPACYFYTYLNATRQLHNIPVDASGRVSQMKAALPIWQEFLARYENFKKFLYHIANSILFEFYSVPMPRRIREIHET
jgi:vitamin K-dependent gamma-carboxylase